MLRAVSGTSERSFRADLDADGAHSAVALDEQLAVFFRERVFLPQSLLGQLLQIYQDAGNDAASPLAQFVGKLLGLDRLDALEAGLKPLVDVRNVRKNVDGWLTAENEKARLGSLLVDRQKACDALNEQLLTTLAELATLCMSLELSVEVQEESLEDVAAALGEARDSEAFAQLADHQRRLASIRREIEDARSATGVNASVPATGAYEASRTFARWEAEHGARVGAIRSRVEVVLPDRSMPSGPSQFVEEALKRLRTEQRQQADLVTQARADIRRHAVALDERDVAVRQRDTIDDEISRLSSSAGSLGSALAELTSFITDDVCPVCDRDFSEVSKIPLSEHVHGKIRTLSASAERLVTLGRVHSEVQVTIERLGREIESIAARRLEEEALAEIDRRLASVETLIAELESIGEVLQEGGRLREADIAARRAVSEAQARHVSLAAARETFPRTPAWRSHGCRG